MLFDPTLRKRTSGLTAVTVALALALSPLSDYYFVTYFPYNTNNAALSAATPQFAYKTSLNGMYQGGDYTRLKAGQTLPSSGFSGVPFFLMFVMSN